MRPSWSSVAKEDFLAFPPKKIRSRIVEYFGGNVYIALPTFEDAVSSRVVCILHGASYSDPTTLFTSTVSILLNRIHLQSVQTLS